MEFREEWIKIVVWECDSSKSPGPYEVNFGFMKEFLEVIKDDFYRFIVEFHSNSRLVRGADSFFIALVSKIENSMKLKDFRLISLIGSMYKVVAKLLANRLKKVVHKVIS